jgi:hypothetical protein
VSRRGTLAAALRCVAACAGLGAAPSWASAAPARPQEGLAFERVFDDAGEPAWLHYEVRYESGAKTHDLEVWRDGQRRLRRRTDDTIDTFVQRSPRDGEFSMTVVDNGRRLSTRIARANLYRLGNFTDWFDLAHGLKHPLASYRLARIEAPTGGPVPIAACTWYALEQSGRVTTICWSERNRLPLVIQSADGAHRWRVTALDRDPVPARVFEIHDAGFVRNDANQDIERD